VYSKSGKASSDAPIGATAQTPINNQPNQQSLSNQLSDSNQLSANQVKQGADGLWAVKLINLKENNLPMQKMDGEWELLMKQSI
jgi:hypothetical protein